MPKKWNLQDIRPAGTSKTPTRMTPVRQSQGDIVNHIPRTVQQKQTILDSDLETIDIIDGNASKRKRVIVTTIISLLIIGLGYIVNIFLSGADVVIHPKTKEISMQSEITTYREPQPNQLSFEILTLEATSEKQVKASGKETVSEHAHGKIFVYNTKSTSPQRLITNTRFEDGEGRIFRIKDSINVPGATSDGKGGLIPGKISTEVYADEPGDQFNIKPTRFTIPGLKGSDQFENVYAESTSDFTGGFNGEKYIIDDTELQTALQQLHLELRDTLLAEYKEKIPAGFVLYENTISFVYNSLPSTNYGDSLATIKERAVLQVPIFKEDEFSHFIASQAIPDYTNEPIHILDPQTLTVAYTDQTVLQTDISQSPTLNFTITGNAKLIWDFDAEKLKNELSGISKNEATTVFANYRSIDNGKSEVRPFWSTKFPSDTKEITVTTVSE